MNELKLVELIRGLSLSHGKAVVEGIGDDCAILRPRSREELLVTTDLMIEGMHFLRETHTPQDCGWKCLARGVSDIAAMGGTPLACFVSLALPEWAGERWVRGFYRGLSQLAGKHGVTCAGGDLSRSKQLTADIVVVGSAPAGKALRRSSAGAGDRICVTGQLGASALGLSTRSGHAWRRHKRPVPRVEAGLAIRQQLRATACMDLSDGLAMDLHRLCLASGVAGALDWMLPVYPGASLQQALMGGEDYELLFTIRPRQKLPREIAGVPLSEVGVIFEGEPGEVEFAGKPLPVAGWDPFRS